MLWLRRLELPGPRSFTLALLHRTAPWSPTHQRWVGYSRRPTHVERSGAASNASISGRYRPDDDLLAFVESL
jgi:hypothetical protein